MSRNTPLTRKQVQALPWGMHITIVSPSRRIIAELRRKAKLWKRVEDRHYAQWIPAKWVQDKKTGEWTPTKPKRIVHQNKIRK